MCIKFYGCILVVDGFNLSKIHYKFACIIPLTKTLAPVSIKTFTSRLLMNKYLLKLYFFGILNLKIFCDNFILQMFNWYVSPLLAPSILLFSISFMVFCWRRTLAKWPNLLQFKHFEFIALHSFIWIGLKGKPHLYHFILSSLFFNFLDAAIWVWSQLVYSYTWNYLFFCSCTFVLHPILTKLL